MKTCKRFVADGCPFGDACKFSHDLPAFMAQRSDDLGPVCTRFNQFGWCKFGATCRFGRAHINDSGVNLRRAEADGGVVEEREHNTLDHSVRVQLRKNTFPFKTARHDKRRRPNKRQRCDDANTTAAEAQAGGATAGVDGSALGTTAAAASAANVRSGQAADSTDIDSAALPPPPPTPTSVATMATPPAAAAASAPLVDARAATAAEPSTTPVASSAAPEHGPELQPSPGVAEFTCASMDCAPAVPFPDREVKLVDFSNKVYVAPLTTVGNLPFRRIMKWYGADITCSEMAMASNLLGGHNSEWALLRRHPSEDVFGAQVAGAFPDQLTRCAEVLEATVQLDFVDVNCGCPIDLVCNKGAGSALMNRPAKIEAIVKGMTSVLSCPLTVKMRTGWNDNKPVAQNIVRSIEALGTGRVAAVMIHGRSRLQRYSRQADWNFIRSVATMDLPSSPAAAAGMPRIPVIGNGDIMSFDQWEAHLEKGGVSSCCMIARGALIKPWLPTEIKERRHWDISASERLDMLRRFVNNGLEHWGSDQQGVNITRRFLLEWLSFLHRYIPVGLLEQPPQRMNDRPPPYVGRNDLETIMSSPDCADWIKISEMLLGPVPDDFKFLPKHKANSYSSTTGQPEG